MRIGSVDMYPYFGNPTSVQAGPDGSFKISYKVQRFVDGHNCARLDHDDRCYITAATAESDYVWFSDITFAPK
jgi:hypothetical protein